MGKEENFQADIAYQDTQTTSPIIRPYDDLSNRDYKNAHLAGTVLIGCTLTMTDLEHANLDGANLTGARLPLALLSGASMIGSDIRRADFSKARMVGAILNKANAPYACFCQTNMTESSLIETDLASANLSGANLAGANMTGSTLHLANLSGTNLVGANLANIDFSTVIADHETLIVQEALPSSQQFQKFWKNTKGTDVLIAQLSRDQQQAFMILMRYNEPSYPQSDWIPERIKHAQKAPALAARK